MPNWVARRPISCDRDFIWRLSVAIARSTRRRVDAPLFAARQADSAQKLQRRASAARQVVEQVCRVAYEYPLARGEKRLNLRGTTYHLNTCPTSSVPPNKRRARVHFAQALLALGRLVSDNSQSEAEKPTRTLVFAPHPDDEVLGCGGTIALKMAAGARVRVVVMTDGRASHARLIDADSLIRMRREEAARAAPHLGLDAADYIFLDFEDHCLQDHFTDARQCIVQMLADFDPEQVFVPHRRDRLSDHVATFEIVQAALQEHRKPVTMFEYPVWLWHTWPWTAGKPLESPVVLAALRVVRDVAELILGCRTRVNVRTVLQRKLAALAEYGSQTRRFRDDPGWPVLSDVSQGAFLERFESGVETFRETPPKAIEASPR